MTTDTDTAKAISTAKGALTKAEKAMADAMASGDMAATMVASAAVQTAQTELNKAEKAHELANREAYLENVVDNRRKVIETLQSIADVLEDLRLAGLKYLDVELISSGNFTVDTRSGQRGVQPGSTRNTEKYEIEVAGKVVEFTAGKLIQTFGVTMDNYDQRMEQIGDKANSMTRKLYAQEITKALGGTVIGGGE